MSEFVQSVLDRLSGEAPPSIRPQLPSRFEPFSLSPEPWTDSGAEQESVADAGPQVASAPGEPAAELRPASPTTPAWPTPELERESRAGFASEPAPRLLAPPAPAWSAGPDFGGPLSTEPRSDSRDDLLHERFNQLDRAMAQLRGEGASFAAAPPVSSPGPDLSEIEASRSPIVASAPMVEAPSLSPSIHPFGDVPSSPAETRSRVVPPVETIEPRPADGGGRSDSDEIVQERLQRLDREIARLRGIATREIFPLQPPAPSSSAPVTDREEFSAPLRASPPADRDQGTTASVSLSRPDAPRLEALLAEPTASSVTISISRIEIRSPQPAAPAAAVRAPSRPSRVVSLDDYLRQRGGGGRS